MAEPQPPTVHEGADTTSVPASNNSDRAAATALSSLDTVDPTDSTPSSTKKEVDTQALGDAIRQLDVTSASSSTSKDSGAEARKAAAEKKREEERRKEEERKKVKVDAADVGLVAEACDVSKARATDLLKSYGGDAVRAMGAWVGAEA